MMHELEKSDSSIVAEKPANKLRITECGAGGAKGGDQGELGRDPHAPDTEPGKCAPGT